MPSQNRSDLRTEIIRIVSQQAGVPPEKITEQTRIVEDLHLDGDDVTELLMEIGQVFQINMKNLRWYHHHGPEGCNPVWLIIRPWWWKKTRIPIYVSDLIEAARSGSWMVDYPNS